MRENKQKPKNILGFPNKKLTFKRNDFIMFSFLFYSAVANLNEAKLDDSQILKPLVCRAAPFSPPGVTKNLEKWIVLLIVNLQFSELVFWTSKKWFSAQVDHLLFSGQLEQTKIEDLGTCLEFGETTDFLSSFSLGIRTRHPNRARHSDCHQCRLTSSFQLDFILAKIHGCEQF